MSKVSRRGRSSTTRSRLVLENSVLETLRTWRFLSLARATTTQNLLLSMNVEFETLSSRRLWSDHSPRQLMRSVTVALVRPRVSSSTILWPLSVLRPLTVSREASLSRT